MRLSERQWEIARLQVDGLTYVEIAARLGIRASTVRTHVGKLRERLGVGPGQGRLLLRLQQLGYLARPLSPEEPEPPLLPGQKLYLQAFDRFLAARRDPRAQEKARAEMRHLLGTMHIERQIEPPPDGDSRRPRDQALERLMGLLG